MLRALASNHLARLSSILHKSEKRLRDVLAEGKADKDDLTEGKIIIRRIKSALLVGEHCERRRR